MSDGNTTPPLYEALARAEKRAEQAEAQVRELRDLLREVAGDYHAYGLLKYHGDKANAWREQPMDKCSDVNCVAILAALGDTDG